MGLQSSVADLAIIGGGICGLYAAYRAKIQHPTWKIIVIDAAPAEKARIESTLLQNTVCDLGAARFCTKTHRQVYNLVQNFQLDIKPYEFEVIKKCSATNLNTPETLKKAKAKLTFGQGQEMTFKQVMSDFLGSEIFNRFCIEQGYNVLESDDLAFDEGSRIICQHPEYESNISYWMYFPAGFEQLTNSLRKAGQYLGVEFVNDFKVHTLKKAEYWQVISNQSETIDSKKVLVTLHKSKLQAIKLEKAQRLKQLLQAICPVPLAKIFFKFDKTFWEELGMSSNTCTITDSLARKIYFYPDGRLLIYTDGHVAESWNQIFQNNSSHDSLWQEVEKIIKEALSLPLDLKFPKPSASVTRFFPEGVYYWKKGFKPQDVFHELLHFEPGLHFCSGDFSVNSGWVEASLSAVESLFSSLQWQGD